ncbi:MaoC/PaaZ C-terminal domain-containing protein [Chloroflexota bacterium]
MNERICYFEDYQVGQEGITGSGFGSRTVTEADIVNFACLTSDYHRTHLSREYMANSIYGDRVAHGLLGSSLVTGMLSLCAPHILGRGVPGAYFHCFDANYRGGIKLGDTIKIQWCVAEKVDYPTHEGFGLVKTDFQLVNQEGTSVYDGSLTIIVRKEAAGDAELRLETGDLGQVTEFVPDPDQDYYAEDWPVGKGGETDGRTITETDIVNFTGLTGDNNPQYVDAEFARRSMFGERIAPGMLVFAIAFGLWMRELNRYRQPKAGVAGHLNDKVTFLAPVKVGDTVRCRYKVTATRVSRSRPEVGIVTSGLQVVNQRNEVVQEGSVVFMIPSRAGLGMQAL